MVSNQDNLGTSTYPNKKYEIVQNKLMRLLNVREFNSMPCSFARMVQIKIVRVGNQDGFGR